VTGRDVMASRPRPRNYLAPGERRRIFWMLMPPALVAFLALGWIEQTWFPRRGPPVEKQVDTRLEVARGASPAGDAVLIEAEPEPFQPAAEGLSASADALAKVRDDAFFRRDEEPAWIQTWLTLRSADPRAVRAAATPVSFTELFGQPLSFRGRPVRFKGTLRRLEQLRAPANDYDLEHYWQGWLEPAVGPTSPIVVQFLRLPPGMPVGLKIAEPAEIAGYFFKRYAYKATDTLRRAPLVMAIEPVWTPRTPVAPGGTSLGTIAVVTMATVIAATALAMYLGNHGNRGNRGRGVVRPEPGGNLDDALAGVDVVSTGESLRRLAAEHAVDPPRTPESES
jgi:hypothetical protein